MEAGPPSTCHNYGRCQMAAGKHSLAKPGRQWSFSRGSGSYKWGASCCCPSRMLVASCQGSPTGCLPGARVVDGGALGA